MTCVTCWQAIRIHAAIDYFVSGRGNRRLTAALGGLDALVFMAAWRKVG
jgi:hypothetical protein